MLYMFLSHTRPSAGYPRGERGGEGVSAPTPIGMRPAVPCPGIVCENRTVCIGAASGIFIRCACGRKTASYAVYMKMNGE